MIIWLKKNLIIYENRGPKSEKLVQCGLDFTMFGFIFVETNSKTVDLNIIFFALFFIDFLAYCVSVQMEKYDLTAKVQTK